MKNFLKEFKEFALKGNVLDLAIGVIIGASFQGIVTSLVGDIISPLLGLFAKEDFKDLAVEVFGVNIKYGSFITAVINFIIMSLVIFILVKLINKVSKIGGKNKNDEIDEPTTKECPFCCSEISINAIRCPKCTSKLSKDDEVMEEKNN